MKHKKLFKLPMLLPLHAAVLSALTVSAHAQEKKDEVVVTIGSRGEARSVFESTAPIDVIGGEDFANQADTDLSTLLRNVVPSYNVNSQPISDAATIVRPANMRGLAPDHTLVLVNSKRRHRAAVIYWLGNGVSDGAQGPDISPIPAAALKQVEVLRDGAAAQYGSDAIAGVMNFVLKDADHGGSLELKAGQFYEGDGQQTTLIGNIGLPFINGGFINLTAEYGNTDATDRSVQRDDAIALIEAGNTDVEDPAQVWGQPEIKDDFKFFYNSGFDVGSAAEIYSFGNYASKEVEGGFYYRNPDTRSGVFSGDGGVTRLVADITPEDGVDCPVVAVGDDDALNAIMDDPNCFVFNEFFPGGFTPKFGGTAVDTSFVGGIKSQEGEGIGGWAWDVSLGYGSNDVDFFIKNTVNASLGPDSPTDFDPGAYTQTDTTLNADISRPFDIGLASDLNVAVGAEWRQEEFEITVGDVSSYINGPYTVDGFSAGSNGFPGFSDIAAGSWTRENFAFYIDAEAHVTDAWLLGVAVRHEDFEDFGTTTNGKISTNVAVTDIFSLRASASTGFRAPTPGQSNAFNVSTTFDFEVNDLVNNGTIPSTDPVAQVKGGEPLDPEKSTNLSAGVILQLGPVDVTLDFFSIELSDRIALSQNFQLTEEEKDELIASGVTSAGSLDTFRFFTNDFDTTTTGVDLVATYGINMLGGHTDFSLAYNHTDTKVEEFSPETISATRIDQLEKGLPSDRVNFSGNYTRDKFHGLVRLSYYSGFYDSEDDQDYGGEMIVDVEGAYHFTDQFSLTVGAQNLLDEYPDENPGGTAVGNLYSQFSPSGFGGGYYYTKLKYSF